MNKTELVAAMAEQTQLSKKDAEAALKAFIDVIMFIPRSSSNAAICLDRVGWVICNCSAAFVKLCSFATVKK